MIGLQLDYLVEGLADMPALPRAACKGRSELFDPADADDYTRTAALRICRGECPELLACARWLNQLPETKRPPGVIAGKILTSQGKDMKRNMIGEN